MHDAYLGFIKQFPEKENDYLKISEYLSSEFAKLVPNDKRYEYKISAAFSKIMFALGMQGLMYPTAKDEGKGFNIALPPSIVDECLRLEKVAVWRIQKKEKKALISPFLFCEAFQTDKKFIWKDPQKPIPPWFVENSLKE